VNIRDNAELVTAEPSQGIAVVKQLCETLGHEAQEDVSDCMSQGVVHGLKTIEVKQKKRRLTGSGIERFLQSGLKVPTVTDARQMIKVDTIHEIGSTLFRRRSGFR
jgi:hypothetical protein